MALPRMQGRWKRYASLVSFSIPGIVTFLHSLDLVLVAGFPKWLDVACFWHQFVFCFLSCCVLITTFSRRTEMV